MATFGSGFGVAADRSGGGDEESQGGGDGKIFNTLDKVSKVGGLATDILKAAKALGSLGFWKDLSKVKYYLNGWTGNGTVKTIGTASALGYGMIGLSVVANVGLSITDQQSWGSTGINLGITGVMLKLPAPVGIGYGLGSIVGEIQQNAFEQLENNGHGDNPNLYNVTW